MAEKSIYTIGGSGNHGEHASQHLLFRRGWVRAAAILCSHAFVPTGGIGNDCSKAFVQLSMRISKTFKTFMQRAQVMRFASIGKGGFAHVVPVCPLFHENKIYFVTDVGAAKLKNIKQHRKVAAVFDHYDPSWRGLKGIMIQGVAKIIRGGDRFYDLRARFYRKFPPYKKKAPFDQGESVILEITPRKAFSWEE